MARPDPATTDVAKVCFTGSVNGGKRIMEMASETLTRVTLELGGNDAAIILEDAILDDDAPGPPLRRRSSTPPARSA